MIPRVVNMQVVSKSIPRESGDDPTCTTHKLAWELYSPRERG